MLCNGELDVDCKKSEHSAAGEGQRAPRELQVRRAIMETGDEQVLMSYQCVLNGWCACNFGVNSMYAISGVSCLRSSLSLSGQRKHVVDYSVLPNVVGN